MRKFPFRFGTIVSRIVSPWSLIGDNFKLQNAVYTLHTRCKISRNLLYNQRDVDDVFDITVDHDEIGKHESFQCSIDFGARRRRTRFEVRTRVSRWPDFVRWCYTSMVFLCSRKSIGEESTENEEETKRPSVRPVILFDEYEEDEERLARWRERPGSVEKPSFITHLSRSRSLTDLLLSFS